MDNPIHVRNQPNVLMVDDTPANLALLSGVLKGRGYKIRAVVSGPLALQAARNDPPDLILLDINMPGMNGYEVCAELKAEEQLKDIPIIFLSALNETVDKVKAFSAGGVDYITKPFQFDEVKARIETHLELRRQKLQLQDNYDKLSELEKLRDSLVHMIIHDLRTPLMIVDGYLDLIQEKTSNTLPADAVCYLAKALVATNQMVQIVNDILDTSKMEEGQMKLKVAECDLSRILEEGVSGLKALLEGREIRFAPPEGPVIVRADREIIFRVIQNLLANAIKFTPKNNGHIRLGLSSAGDRVRVSVQNDGPSIGPEYREKIFEKFVQVESPAGRGWNSTGLGLTFCKLAVEAHDGRIWVDSEEGQGSCFLFELPVNGPRAASSDSGRL